MQTKQQQILDLGPEISETEIKLSNALLELIANKKVVAARLLSIKRKELTIVFDDNTTLFVDNFNDNHDISVVSNSG